MNTNIKTWFKRLVKLLIDSNLYPGSKMASQGDLGINSIISDFDELTYYNSTQIVLWGLSK